jgi:hypothetical protein
MAALAPLGFENCDQYVHQVLLAEVGSRTPLVSGGRADGRGPELGWLHNIIRMKPRRRAVSYAMFNPRRRRRQC